MLSEPPSSVPVGLWHPPLLGPQLLRPVKQEGAFPDWEYDPSFLDPSAVTRGCVGGGWVVVSTRVPVWWIRGRGGGD
jgi:hypothetical protein